VRVRLTDLFSFEGDVIRLTGETWVPIKVSRLLIVGQHVSFSVDF